MGARAVDDKPSDTLVAGPWRRALDGEFDSPPSPPPILWRVLVRFADVSAEKPPTARSGTAGQLLNRPLVAVRIGEVDERAPRLHVDPAYRDTAIGESLPDCLDVVDDDHQPLLGAGLHLHDPRAEHDGAGRTRRRELDEPDPLVNLLVVVGMEPDLVDVEGFRPIHVG